MFFFDAPKFQVNLKCKFCGKKLTQERQIVVACQCKESLEEQRSVEENKHNYEKSKEKSWAEIRKNNKMSSRRR